ncbi:prepilin-type N-terminal cleavage/methylation domain-containing protein [Thermodesulfobacteriota bacterium]
MKSDKGFTLVELLIAMVITVIVMSAVYSVYYSQQKSYRTQQQVAMMQQNLRGAMIMLTKDIRMAGYDPIGVVPTPAVLTADSQDFRFIRVDDSGTATEQISYRFNSNELQRDEGGGYQTMAENIDAVNFVYLGTDNTALSSPVADPSLVRSVQVTMVARAAKGDPGYVDNNVYENQSGVSIFVPAADDNRRRRVLSRQIKCRNLGL